MKSLKNKLLISMPNMVDPYFAKSVIFICEDDTNGTMGIIVNKPISQMKIVSSGIKNKIFEDCLLYTSPSPRDLSTSRMPSSA